jgi:hypothetical protein
MRDIVWNVLAMLSILVLCSRRLVSFLASLEQDQVYELSDGAVQFLADTFCWYDEDGDGYGADYVPSGITDPRVASPAYPCGDPNLNDLPPAGREAPLWVTRGGDCDDSNPDTNPACPDPCDGIDNNCSGVADEGFDSDADGAAGWREEFSILFAPSRNQIHSN